MKRLTNALLILTLLTVGAKLNAQNPVIDSLKLALKNAKQDTNLIKILLELSEVCETNEIKQYAEPCISLCEKGIKLNKQNRDFYWKNLASALNNLGYMELEQGNVTTAKKLYIKSLDIREDINDLEGIAYSLNNLGYINMNTGKIPEALDYYQRSLQLQEKLKNKFGIGYALRNIGEVKLELGNISEALSCFEHSLELFEQIKNKKEMANSLNSLAIIYTNQGNIPKALDYLHRTLKISEELKNEHAISSYLGNLGRIYDDLREYDKALDYFNQSLQICEKIKDVSGTSSALNNIGLVYDHQNRNEKAIEYYNRSLKIELELMNKDRIASAYNNIAGILLKQNNIDESLILYKKSLGLNEELKNEEGISLLLDNIAGVLLKQDKVDEAFTYADKSLKIAKKLGYPVSVRNSALRLKKIYQKQNKFKEALKMYELEIQMRDSISNLETKKASIKKQFQYQYEKRAAADSVKNAEEQKVKNALLNAQQAQLKQEKTKSYALYGGLALVMVFAGFMVNRFRVTHKQKQIIELKEIETQKQNEIITHQKHLVEEKHKEITDSINYAERIQRSFLASKEILDNNLSFREESGTEDYFVFFQPKDVVSGDFYWASKLTNGNFALATADSTGHGVPGAIMSILNISCLEKAVEQERLTEPAEILNHTRTKIIERLKKDGSEEGGKDGMDCSLICFDFANSKLTYAAANNPVWIVRASAGSANSNELIELPSDKMPVGKNDRDNVPFKQNTVHLQKDDVVYALTDGLPDQFGGPKGKKFMYKQLKELLLSIAHLSMYEQKEMLKTSLNNWKGNLEQVDDICVIGIRI